jgi:hypothetical protein
VKLENDFACSDQHYALLIRRWGKGRLPFPFCYLVRVLTLTVLPYVARVISAFQPYLANITKDVLVLYTLYTPSAS